MATRNSALLRFALTFAGAGSLCLNAGIGSLVATPNLVTLNTLTVVTFTANVAFQPTLVASSVNLTEVTADSRLVSVIGQMYDDGTHGDVLAGDGFYSARVAVTRAAPGYVWYRATAAYQGVIARSLSPLASVFVTGPGCFYSIDRGSINPPSAGASAALSVFAPAGCAWTASSNASWISVTSGASGQGNGSVGFRVDANTLATVRTGALSIANLTFQVTQAARVCSYALDTDRATFPAAGGSGQVSVMAPAGCPWSATSNAPWAFITSGTPGAGNGLVRYRVDPNTVASPRSGTFSIAGLPYAVVQLAGGPSGPTCSVAADPVNIRSTGLTELTADLTIRCANLPPSGITADLNVVLNTNITRRTSSGNPTSEALLLLNEPVRPVLGVNAFQAILTGYTSMQFPNVVILPASGDTATLRVVNTRVDATTVAGSAVSATVVLSSVVPVSMTAPSAAVATISDDPVVFSSSVGALPASPAALTLTVRELLPTAFRIRTGAARSLDPAAEAGFWSESLGNLIGAADSGTRFRAVFSALPGVNIYAPVYPLAGQGAQLVSADSNGAGGAFMTGSTLGGAYVLLTPQAGTITATWEVRTANPAVNEQYSFNVLITGASASQLASILKGGSLAPVSSLSKPLAIPSFKWTAPVPLPLP